MKRLIRISAVFVALAAIMAFMPVKKDDAKSDAVATAADKIEVYYFHFSRRCVTCMAVENKTREAVAELYPDAFKKGTITFASVNLDDDTSKPLAEKAKVSGQALVILSGEFKKDLTAEGFMYANRDYEKLKAEIKKVIDPLVKEIR
jgi:hypothetical protein